MAERKVGRVVNWHSLSSNLAIFRVVPDNGSKFPVYRPGQYIAIGRDDCRLTRKIAVDGKIHTVPDLDDCGRQKFGQVTHSYSIASAPFETQNQGYLEFYLVLERDGDGHPGRLTESLFRLDLNVDNKVHYLDRVQGNFTMDNRIGGSRNVLFVGTGTGVAPFVSMIKQLHHEASTGQPHGAVYTLIHVSRTQEELGYFNEFMEIEKSGKLDFLYIPAVSRPVPADRDRSWLGVGRANNILRSVLGMPLKEVEDAATPVRSVVQPQLPPRLKLEDVRSRLNPEDMVLMSCGNPHLLADMQYIATKNHIRFEREDW